MQKIWESKLLHNCDYREFLIGKDVKLMNTLSMLPIRKYHGLRVDDDITLITLGDSILYVLNCFTPSSQFVLLLALCLASMHTKGIPLILLR